MADLNFSELAGQNLSPTIAIETDFLSGVSISPEISKRLLLIGYKISGGTATANEVYEIPSEGKGRTLFGEGSMLSNMIEAAMRQKTQYRLFAMAYAEGGGVQATEDITITGTSATTAGEIRGYIAGRLVRAGIEVGDTPTTAGDALVAAIGDIYNMPITSSNSTGTVSITARHAGVEGNTIRLDSIECTAAGLTATAGAAVLSGGTLAGDPTTGLANLQADRFHHICCGTNDSASLVIVETHVDLQSGATVQKWCDMYGATNGNEAAATALAAALDNKRAHIAWAQNCPNPCWEIAAANAAEIAGTADRKQNQNGHVLKFLKPPVSRSSWPIKSELNSSIAAGVTPIRFDEKYAYIDRQVTTWTTDSTFRDTAIMQISDYCDEDYIERIRSRYSDAALKVDSLPNTQNVVSPDRMLDVLKEAMADWEALDYIQGSVLDAELGNLISQANSLDANRIDTGFPFRAVQQAITIAAIKNYVEPLSIGG